MNLLDRIDKWIAPPAFITAVMVAIAICAGTTMTVAHASPDYPNVGVFAPNTLHCGRVETPNGPELQFGGVLETKKVVIIRLSTESWWPKLPKEYLSIEYNGRQYLANGNEFQVGGWGKPYVNNKAPEFTIRIKGLPTGQKVSFDARWMSSPAWGNIADGWVDQPDCSFTTNPRR